MSSDALASAVGASAAITCGLLPWLYGRFHRRAARRSITDAQVAAWEHEVLSGRSVLEWNHPTNCTPCIRLRDRERSIAPLSSIPRSVNLPDVTTDQLLSVEQRPQAWGGTTLNLEQR